MNVVNILYRSTAVAFGILLCNPNNVFEQIAVGITVAWLVVTFCMAFIQLKETQMIFSLDRYLKSNKLLAAEAKTLSEELTLNTNSVNWFPVIFCYLMFFVIGHAGYPTLAWVWFAGQTAHIFVTIYGIEYNKKMRNIVKNTVNNENST